MSKRTDQIRECEPIYISLLRKNYPDSQFTTPIKLSEDDLIPALDLLTHQSQGKGALTGELRKNSHQFDGPVIVVTSTHDGDSGGFYSDSVDIPVTKELFNLLRSKGYVYGKPKWGHSSDYEFVITEEGSNYYWSWKKERRERKFEEEKAKNHAELTKLYDDLPRPIT